MVLDAIPQDKPVGVLTTDRAMSSEALAEVKESLAAALSEGGIAIPAGFRWVPLNQKARELVVIGPPESQPYGLLLPILAIIFGLSSGIAWFVHLLQGG